MTGSIYFREGTPLVGQGSPLTAAQQQLISDLQRREQDRATQLPGDAPRDSRRRTRVVLTRDEMWAQPQVIAETLEQEAQFIREAGVTLEKRQVRRLYMVGCGDSLAAAIGVRPLLEALLGCPCEAVESLEYAHYLYGQTDSRTAVIAISSSGVTTRTVEALLRARSCGALVIAVSNTQGTPLMTEADLGLYVHAIRNGWPTQASTGAMAVLYRLGMEAGRARGVETAELERGLAEIPAQMATALRDLDGPTTELSAALATRPIHLFAGGGPSWATALFGAAKVRECTPMHAVAIHLEEFHHYNSQKAGDPLFLIASDGPSLSRALDTAVAGKSLGGQVFAVTDSDRVFEDLADLVLRIPSTAETLSPLLTVVPLQLFAFHLAIAQFKAADEMESPGPELPLRSGPA